jgi:hypothetical protein
MPGNGFFMSDLRQRTVPPNAWQCRTWGISHTIQGDEQGGIAAKELKELTGKAIARFLLAALLSVEVFAGCANSPSLL